MPITKAEINTLSMTEKHELLEMLWESIEHESYIDNTEEKSEEEKTTIAGKIGRLP